VRRCVGELKKQTNAPTDTQTNILKFVLFVRFVVPNSGMGRVLSKKNF
jgi:hypothetical protein